MRRPISSLTVPVLLLIALQAPPARAQRPPAINGSAPLAAHAAGEARDTALDADALLRRCMEAERRARSLTADYRRETRSAGQLSVLSGTLQLTKPNLALIRVRGAVPSDTLVYRSDALNFVTYRPAESDYFSQPSDDSGRHIQSTGCVEAAAFFDPSVIRTYRGQAARVTIGAPLTIDGARCTRVVLEGAPGRSTFQLYIGADQLLRGMRSVIGPQLSIESRISRVRSPAAIPSAVFAWKPPPGTRPSAGSTCRFAISDRLRDPALTAPGRNAPDFPVTCAGPGIRGLFGLLRQRKAIVLDFWG
ncbi:MAG TPA: hypothetical protein VKT77_14845, partial [Chthonomonadaceae bacterium]|nr:hypothetical protein [Chthonomonadaceae bacterium]